MTEEKERALLSLCNMGWREKRVQAADEDRSHSRLFWLSSMLKIHLSVFLGTAREQSLTARSLGATQPAADLPCFSNPWGSSVDLGTRARWSQEAL